MLAQLIKRAQSLAALSDGVTNAKGLKKTMRPLVKAGHGVPCCLTCCKSVYVLLEHEASVGIDAVLIGIRGAGVVHA